MDVVETNDVQVELEVTVQAGAVTVNVDEQPAVTVVVPPQTVLVWVAGPPGPMCRKEEQNC